MTTSPSLDQVERWVDMLEHRSDLEVFTAIAQWGADQELGACLAYAGANGLSLTRMRAARRPKPPSLKEQALEALQNMDYMNQFPNEHDYNTIRRALEALPND